jgi:peptide/nickel transport system substrate-binding protein
MPALALCGMLEEQYGMLFACNRSRRVTIKTKVSLFLVVVLLFVGALPAVAQGGTGGIIIEGNFGSDPTPFNPLLCTDTACDRIYQFLIPDIIGVDPSTGQFAASGENSMVRDALATSWEISDDGTVYTLHLRDDMQWSDGEPVTAHDYAFAWQAVTSGQTDTNLGYLMDTIASIEAVDDYTVVVTFYTPGCNAFNDMTDLNPIPAHVFSDDFSLFNDNPWNLDPTVSAGPFVFGQFRPAELTTVLANPNYPDAEMGAVLPEGFIYKQVPDQTVLVEQFLAGELNFIDNPAVERRSDIRAAAETGEIQVYDYPGDRWDFFNFNLADPANPQNGVDENGNVIPQDPHPIFGDVRVRQAIALAVDVDAIIDGAVFGEGERMASNVIPGSWAYNEDLTPIPYDPDAALALLDEAGWRDEDGNGVLEAHGAMYAEDGTELAFSLYTNEGNTRRAAIGTIIQDQLSQIGIAVDFQAIDFNTLLDIGYSQTFDAIILGWRQSYPDSPDQTQYMSSGADVVGSGDNWASYDNAEIDDLMLQAKNYPGCDVAGRKAIYDHIQEIMQADLPYLWLFTQNGMYAARSNVENFNPYPANWRWNIDSWSITAD